MKKPAPRTSPAAPVGKGTTAPPAFTPLTALLGGAGLISIVSGFVLLSTGSITLAPVLLVLGYVVLIPLAILR